MPEACRLCASQDCHLLFEQAKPARREYLHCRGCGMVWVPEQFLISPRLERERYLQHNNDPRDEGYRRFLSRLLDEIASRTPTGAEGLDYGSGPTPVLTGMLQQAGFVMRKYDLYFHRDESALDRAYDFIACCETAEHFRNPRAELDGLDAMLSPGGLLGIMTGMLEDWGEFERWHYRRDDTHISFYAPRTMQWIARKYGWGVELPRPNVAIFRKPC